MLNSLLRPLHKKINKSSRINTLAITIQMQYKMAIQRKEIVMLHQINSKVTMFLSQYNKSHSQTGPTLLSLNHSNLKINKLRIIHYKHQCSLISRHKLSNNLMRTMTVMQLNIQVDLIFRSKMRKTFKLQED